MKKLIDCRFNNDANKHLNKYTNNALCFIYS